MTKDDEPEVRVLKEELNDFNATTQSINFDAFQAAAYRTCFSRKYLCTTWGCI